MKVCKAIENVLKQTLKMELVNDDYVGSFKDMITDDVVVIRCFEGEDDLGYKRLLFKVDDYYLHYYTYTLDQILESVEKDSYRPLGHTNVIQFCLELIVPSSLDDKIEDTIKDALD